jgi:hypothetical protein
MTFALDERIRLRVALRLSSVPFAMRHLPSAGAVPFWALSGLGGDRDEIPCLASQEM